MKLLNWITNVKVALRKIQEKIPHNGLQLKDHYIQLLNGLGFADAFPEITPVSSGILSTPGLTPQLVEMASFKIDNGHVDLPEGHGLEAWLANIRKQVVNETLDKNTEAILAKMGVKFDFTFQEGLGKYCRLKADSTIEEGTKLYNWCKNVMERKREDSLDKDEATLLDAVNFTFDLKNENKSSENDQGTKAAGGAATTASMTPPTSSTTGDVVGTLLSLKKDHVYDRDELKNLDEDLIYKICDQRNIDYLYGKNQGRKRSVNVCIKRILNKQEESGMSSV